MLPFALMWLLHRPAEALNLFSKASPATSHYYLGK
jgi:hypothetical protein